MWEMPGGEDARQGLCRLQIRKRRRADNEAARRCTEKQGPTAPNVTKPGGVGLYRSAA